MFVDPDGKLPNVVVGALVGGVTNYLGQALVSICKDYSVKEAFITNIDWVDVGVSALEGAATSGASAIKNITLKAGTKAVTSAVSGAVQGGVNWSPNSSWEMSGIDAVFGCVNGAISGALPSIETKVNNKGHISNTKAVANAVEAKGQLTVQEKNAVRIQNSAKVKENSKRNNEIVNLAAEGTKTMTISAINKIIDEEKAR